MKLQNFKFYGFQKTLLYSENLDSFDSSPNRFFTVKGVIRLLQYSKITLLLFVTQSNKN